MGSRTAGRRHRACHRLRVTRDHDLAGSVEVRRSDDVAARRLDSAKLKKALGVKRTRFATPEELHDLTGLVPGAVPPFGEPVLSLPLYLDASVLANDRIAFNAGSLTDSIIMSVDDYRRIASIEQVIDVAR